MTWRLGLLVVTALCAASLASAQEAQRPSSDRARAGVGLGLQVHIPFNAQRRPQRTTSVAANAGWTSCGLTVTPGMHVAIDVRDGRWASGRRAGLAARSDSAGAEGYAESAGREPNAPLPRANVGALIARVGNGQPFFVGSHYVGDPPGIGELQLAINDDLDRRSDNRGVLTVTCVATRETPAFVPPQREPPPREEPAPESAPVVTTPEPAPEPKPEPTVAAAPPPPPIIAPTPDTTIETTTTVAPTLPPARPATPWGWIIAALITGAALLALLVQAASGGAIAAGAITTRVVDDGVTEQKLTIKPGRKK